MKILDTSLTYFLEFKVSSSRNSKNESHTLPELAACALPQIYPESETSLLRVFARKNLESYWQSIQCIQQEGRFRYEALIRGPLDSELHRADKLFGAAMSQSRLADMEKLALETHFGAHQCLCGVQRPTKLTINISPNLLFDKELQQQLQMHPFPELVCLELTEHLPVDD